MSRAKKIERDGNTPGLTVRHCAEKPLGTRAADHDEMLRNHAVQDAGFIPDRGHDF